MTVQSFFAFSILTAATAAAQLAPPNDRGVAMGHLHILTHDVGAQERFWALLGGRPTMNDRAALIEFPGGYIMLRKGEPTAGSAGSVINHFGFLVPNLAQTLEKVQAAGYKIDRSNPAANFIIGPDDVRVEMQQDADMKIPIRMHHIHFYFDAPLEAQAWYAKVFGALPGKRGNFDAADLPGINLTFSKAQTPLMTTKGRSLDHIGFEVKNLERFVKELESQGLTIEAPIRRSASAKRLKLAYLTDPWGTYIELTENLAP